jgi:2-polyprenyl-3-methyl-5-hydroxy-6-metoxy-1,4-benzoquinol methylase
VLDVPSVEALGSLYAGDAEYNSYTESRREPGRTAMYERVLDRLLTQLSPASDRSTLHDVGAGVGDFLVAAQRRGFAVSGNELSQPAIRACRERTGIALDHGDLADEPGQNRFDAITLWCVIAHVADPRSLLQQAWRLQRPGGVLFLHTPRWCAYDTVGRLASRLSAGRLHHISRRRINDAHLRLYNRANLGRLLEDVGYQVVSAEPTVRLQLQTVSYLDNLRVPARLQHPLAAVIEPLLALGLAPRNSLQVIARKPGARTRE